MKILALPLALAAAAFAAFAALDAFAQGQPAPKPAAPSANFSSVKLTAQDVDRFVKAFPDMVKQFKDLNFSPASSDASGGVSSNVGGLVDSLKAKDKLESFAKSKGYSDGAVFATHCGSILLSYYVLKVDEARKQMAGEAAGLPQEAKAMLDAQFKKLDEQVATQKKALSQETIDAVKAKLPELDKAIQSCGSAAR